MTDADADAPDEPGPALASEVQRLIDGGEHIAAAAALRHEGFGQRAGEIYERLFAYDDALAAYESANDVRSAMRVALRAQDADAVDRVITRATQTGESAALVKLLAADGRHREIGRIYQALGDIEAAADAYEKAGAFLAAAHCREELGDARGAGLLFERHLDESGLDAEACLHLGRIVGRFSRHNDAIELFQRALQHALDRDAMLRQAAPAMILSFSQLGYEGAAAAILERWAAVATEADDVPASVADFLSSDRAAAFAAVVQTEAGAQSGTAASGASPVGVAEESALLLAGRYLLGEPLGGGGVGQVFRAYDALLDQPAAVKIFGSQAMASEAVQSYAREARAAATLQHPAIARVVELNMAQGYVVSELVDGASFEHRLQAGGSASWLMPAIRALLDMLAACHRVGLVHGALKPTNVFAVTGGIRVVDFGAHHLLALRSTETGGLASVWPYLAPEQLFGAPADTSADLYATFAMLYRALCGRPPFASPEADRRTAPPAPSTVRPQVPAAWDEFFARALSPDPAERFEDARAAEAELPLLGEDFVLQAADSLTGEGPTPVSFGEAERYRKGALVFRSGQARVYEGKDITLDRPVWLIDIEDEALDGLAACARLSGRGVQPVYDILTGERRAVVARDAQGRVAELARLREFPQALCRDLASVALALEGMHQAGWALGGFEPERGLGPVGPRLRLAPAPLPVEVTDEAREADWASFAALVAAAFELDTDSEAETRAVLLHGLEQQKALGRADVDALAGRGEELAPWGRFLEATADTLVANASSRVIARLAVGMLRGESRPD